MIDTLRLIVSRIPLLVALLWPRDEAVTPDHDTTGKPPRT